MNKVLEQFSLKNRVAVVTGACGGLGRQLVSILLDAGASLILLDIDEKMLSDLAHELDNDDKVMTLVCDVTSKESIEHAIIATHQNFGRIDILVNCAGILGNTQLLFDITEDEWNHVLDVNLKGTWQCGSKVAKYMIEHQIQGKIVNISSALGYISCLRRIPYAPSKAAVEHLTRNMAMELIEYGINVNCLAPGMINTPMVRQLLRGEAGAKWRQVMPMQRAADPEELCGPLLLLASDASSYMTGVILRVDGGLAYQGVPLPE